MVTVYLGSASQARRNILKHEVLKSDINVVICPSNVDENIALGSSIEDACLENLRKEGRQFSDDDYLICGDCVVITKSGEVRGKPTDLETALAWLDTYHKDKYIGVVQAIEVTNLGTGERFLGSETCGCEIHGIPEEGREQFLISCRALDVAGGVTIEDPFLAPHVVRYLGGTKSSILGLSINLAKELFRLAGAEEILIN